MMEMDLSKYLPQPPLGGTKTLPGTSSQKKEEPEKKWTVSICALVKDRPIRLEDIFFIDSSRLEEELLTEDGILIAIMSKECMRATKNGAEVALCCCLGSLNNLPKMKITKKVLDKYGTKALTCE